MKKLISIGLWVIGGLCFLFSFVILVLCMLFLPQKTTYRIAGSLFGVLIKLMGIKLIVTGQENIIADKPYLIMGNHQSLFDLLVVPVAIPLCFVAVEAAYHFSLPVWGALIRKWGCIPIERNNIKKAVSSLAMAKKTLLSGMSIAILPEGHRTLTGRMAPFKKGPFHLAKGAQTDILPFAINGLFNYHQKSNLILRPGKVKVNIGKPIPFETFKNLSVEEIRQIIFDRILKLSQK